jgi:RNase P/RNase MRP subunit POP5
MKIKLDAHSRLKRRYLLVRGSQKEISQAMQEYLGIWGMAKAAPLFVEAKSDTVLAVNREMLIHVKASFALSNHQIEVLRVSGTLKGLLRKT